MTCWHTDSYELRDGRRQAVWSQATTISPHAPGDQSFSECGLARYLAGPGLLFTSEGETARGVRCGAAPPGQGGLPWPG